MAITKAQRQYVRELRHRKARRKYGAFAVEGLVNVGELLASPAEVQLLVGTAEGLMALRQNAPRVPFPAETHEVGAAAIERVSAQVRPSGVVAVARTFDHGRAVLAESPRLLYLDGVNDPGNAGTLLRTAEWFGFGGVVASPKSVDFYNPKVVAAARGSLFRMAHGEVGLAELIAARGPSGGELFVADLAGAPLHEVTWPTEGVLLIGSESHGPSSAAVALVERGIGTRVTIPGGATATESLNAAVAGGILMAAWR